MIKDPIITAKIRFIKGILKNHTTIAKSNKKIWDYNNKIMLENLKYGPYGMTFHWPADQKERFKKYIDSDYSSDTITHVHIYYLRLKAVNKQHTKDDKAHEDTLYYKASIQKLEKGFLVSQNAGKEGHHVA